MSHLLTPGAHPAVRTLTVDQDRSPPDATATGLPSGCARPSGSEAGWEVVVVWWLAAGGEVAVDGDDLLVRFQGDGAGVAVKLMPAVRPIPSR